MMVSCRFRLRDQQIEIDLSLAVLTHLLFARTLGGDKHLKIGLAIRDACVHHHNWRFARRIANVQGLLT
jgi:hypothetical protein